jgi:hypothetical protein
VVWFDPCVALQFISNSPLNASVTASPTNSDGCPLGKFFAGTNVTLTATSSDGYPFAFWDGSISQSTSNPLSINVTLAAVIIVRANFLCIPFTVLSNDATRGNVSITPLSSAGCISGMYTSGTSVTVTATSVDPFSFFYWSGKQYSKVPSFSLITGITPATEVASFTFYSQRAIAVWGQTDFTSGDQNMGAASPSASSLLFPFGVATDNNNTLYGPCMLSSDCFKHFVLMVEAVSSCFGASARMSPTFTSCRFWKQPSARLR